MPASRGRARTAVVAAACAAGLALAGCTYAEPPAAAAEDAVATAPTGPSASPPAPLAPPTPLATPRTTDSPAAPPSPSASPSEPATPRPKPLAARLSVPAVGIDDLAVVPYAGSPDDRPGTRIQDRGVAASPFGRAGGVGPGQVGNYIVTAHRTSHGGPMRRLPDLEVGDRIEVRAGETVYTYTVTGSMTISFRSPDSLARQSAPVPGRPGVVATRAMITLSTCATPEDHAAGNYWTDSLGNPEHRIDKVGVLTSTRI